MAKSYQPLCLPTWLQTKTYYPPNYPKEKKHYECSVTISWQESSSASVLASLPLWSYDGPLFWLASLSPACVCVHAFTAEWKKEKQLYFPPPSTRSCSGANVSLSQASWKQLNYCHHRLCLNSAEITGQALYTSCRSLVVQPDSNSNTPVKINSYCQEDGWLRLLGLDGWRAERRGGCVNDLRGVCMPAVNSCVCACVMLFFLFPQEEQEWMECPLSLSLHTRVLEWLSLWGHSLRKCIYLSFNHYSLIPNSNPNQF